MTIPYNTPKDDKRKYKQLHTNVTETVHMDFKIKSMKEGKFMDQKLKELVMRYIKFE